MNEPLKFEVHGENTESYFRLYECEHVTSGSYPMETAVPFGEHTNLLFCKHCWAHIEGMVLGNILKGEIEDQVRSRFRDIFSQAEFIHKTLEAIEAEKAGQIDV